MGRDNVCLNAMQSTFFVIFVFGTVIVGCAIQCNVSWTTMYYSECTAHVCVGLDSFSQYSFVLPVSCQRSFIERGTMYVSCGVESTRKRNKSHLGDL